MEEVPTFIKIFVILTCNALVKGSVADVKHGSSYTIHNEITESFLTSTLHTFRPDYGFYPGKVLSTEFIGSLNQIWDVIRWPGMDMEYFWLISKGASLNTISAIYSPESPIPTKNLVQFIPVNVTISTSDTDDTSNTNKTAFLIKSLDLNTCIQSQSLDYEISYRRCNAENRAQHWFLDYFYEDKKNTEDTPALGRNKLKFYCKFHG